MTEEAIRFENVTYTYGSGTPFCRVALDNASFSVKSGRITAIIGHTGSGKSTAVQLMNGLLRPDCGNILLFGKNIWEEPKKISSVRFRVGLVFQYPEYQLFEETVYKDVAFGPGNMGLSEAEIRTRVNDALSFVGIGKEYLEKSPFELSGGEKRRVAIAGVIAMDPDVLILDEPAAGLDPMGRESILGAIGAYQREKNGTVVIVSHSMESTARFAQDVIVLSAGKVALSGGCGEVFSHGEELEAMGLRVPQVTALFKELRMRGLDVRDNVFTVEDAVNELRTLYDREVAKCSET